MLERVIENWLTKSTEKTFQIPFCYMLQANGYTVVHISRHCGMELGKDIIALDKNGTPCAFQLKSAPNGKIGLKQWKEELHGQMLELVTLDIIHPAVKSRKPHRSFLVTNGDLEEEVSIAIAAFNNNLKKQKINSKLEVFLKGNLVEMANSLQENLWPSELTEVKAILEFYLEDGKENFKKDRLAFLLASIYNLNEINKSKITNAGIKRRCASGALLTALALNMYMNVNNYVAVIEGWMIYISYTLAFFEKQIKIDQSYWNEIVLAKQFIYNNLIGLFEEVRERKHFIEGDYLVDQPVYRIRMTQVLAYMSLLNLWRKDRKEQDEINDFIKSFILKKLNKIQIWGEVAIIQSLVIYWSYRKVEGGINPDIFLYQLIDLICKYNKPKAKSPGLPNVYYSADDILPHLLSISDKPLNDQFIGSSFVLEGLIYIFTERNLRQHMKNVWPDISHMFFSSFEPEQKWEFYLWRAEKGINKKIAPKHRQSWNELRQLARVKEFDSIPELLKKDLMIFVLFILVFPHRFNSDIARYLHQHIKSI